MATAQELPDLLAALLREGREGSLIVSDGESRKSIYLSPTGVRLLSSGKRRGVRIGEVLLKTGKITPRQLELVLEKQQKSNLRFGELLYLMCMITEDDIKQAVRTQIEEEIYDLFMWAGAQVEFREGPPPQELTDPSAPITNLTFHVSTLLEESGRRMDEYAKWRHKLPGPDVALSKLPPQPGRSELPLDDRSIQVLELCDGRRGLEQVVDSSPMFRYETLRTLALLISTGRCAAGGRVMSVGMPTPEALPSSMVSAAAGPAAGTAPAPGDLRSGPPGAPRETTRFGLDSVPDVDWNASHPQAGAAPPKDPGTRRTQRPGGSTAPEDGPAPPPPGSYKEQTSLLMRRAAAEKPSLLPPPLPLRRAARLGWVTAAVLLLLLVAAVGYEALARLRFEDADRAAREAVARGDDAAARGIYEAFADSWFLSGVARASRGASRSLVDASARRDAAGLDMRRFAVSRLAAYAALPIEKQEALCGEANAWATDHREPELAAACEAWRDRIRAYRLDAAALIAARRRAIEDRRIREAQELTVRARTQFGLDPDVRGLLLPVAVQSTPSGAEITVNGVLQGVRTPAVVEVSPEAPLSLRLDREGCAPVDRSFPGPPGDRIDVLLFSLPRWSARVAGSASLHVDTSDGLVFAVGDDGAVTALALADGRLQWRVRPGTHPMVTAPRAVKGMVLVGAEDGAVWALDVSDGTALRQSEVGPSVRGSLAVSQDGTLVYAGTSDRGVVALDAVTGKLLGRVALPADLAYGPYGTPSGWIAVCTDGAVVCGTTDRLVSAARLPAPCGALAPPAMSDLGLLCPCTDQSLVLVTFAGAIQWSTSPLEAPLLGVAADSGRAVAVVRGSTLRAFQLTTGAPVWSTPLDGAVAAPPAAGAGRLVVAGEDGVTRFFEIVNGTPLGGARTGRCRARAVLVREGALFITEAGEVRLVP